MNEAPDVFTLLCERVLQYWEHFAVAIIGFLGGAIAHLNDVAGKRRPFSWMALFAGALASSFLSPVCYLIFKDAFGFSPELSFWLAGFLSFLGADQIKAKINQFIDARLPG